MKFKAAVIAAVVSGFTYAAQADPSGEPRLGTEPCKLTGLSEPVRCGVLVADEDPAKSESRRLKIHFAILPALSGHALPDPLVLIMGGPGEGAIDEAGDAAARYAALRADRDILLVDQRGAGQSAPLRCDFFSEKDPGTSLVDLFPPHLVETCARKLSEGADLTRYSFIYAAHDLEAIRRGLGYRQLNLLALSYGTRAAQVFMRAYPASVRTAYLGSVVPIDLPIPLTFARTAQSALERMLTDCEEDPACHATFPNVREDATKTFAQLVGDHVRVRLPGAPDPAMLGRGRVAEWVRAQLYRPASAAILPKAFHHAASGDWSLIVDGVLANARGADHALNLGLLLSVTCDEDVPFVREQDVAPETDETFLGSYRLRQQQAACAAWPRSPVQPDYRRPVVTDIPTLFVTGDRDGGTPLWFTDHVASGFSQRAIVVAHGEGHTGWSDCLAALHRLLVQTGTTDGMNTVCPKEPLPPFSL